MVKGSVEDEERKGRSDKEGEGIMERRQEGERAVRMKVEGRKETRCNEMRIKTRAK